MKRKKFIPLISISIISLLLTLLGAEIVLRFLFKRSLAQLAFSTTDMYYVTDSSGVRQHIPNSTGYERLWNNEGRWKTDESYFRHTVKLARFDWGDG